MKHRASLLFALGACSASAALAAPLTAADLVERLASGGARAGTVVVLSDGIETGAGLIALYAKAGFTPALRARAEAEGVRLVRPAELVAGNL